MNFGPSPLCLHFGIFGPLWAMCSEAMEHNGALIQEVKLLLEVLGYHEMFLQCMYPMAIKGPGKPWDALIDSNGFDVSQLNYTHWKQMDTCLLFAPSVLSWMPILLMSH